MFRIVLFLIFLLSSSIAFSQDFSGEPGEGATGESPGYRPPGAAPEPKKEPDDSLIDKGAHSQGFDFDTEDDTEDSRFFGVSDVGGEGSK